MGYNRKIEEGYKQMNSMMKLTDIKIILMCKEENKCPYCSKKLSPYAVGGEKKLGCNFCQLDIDISDYLNAVYNKVHGFTNEKIRYKSLDDY
ncbi:MAG: hypothetical protein GY853_16485 [PVC group bacterium]|nr:hypothetical protein [PVC group bacterium]